MATVKIIGGDYRQGTADYVSGTLCMPSGKKISASSFQYIQPISDEQVKGIAGTLGWGVVGGAALGPVGLAAGLLAGGNGKKITFIAEERLTGKKIMGVTSSKAYTDMYAKALTGNTSKRTDRFNGENVEKQQAVAQKIGPEEKEITKPDTEDFDYYLRPDKEGRVINKQIPDKEDHIAAELRKEASLSSRIFLIAVVLVFVLAVELLDF